MSRRDRPRAWSRAMVGVALAAVAGLGGGCIESDTTACSWGTVCPSEMVCDELHLECVYPAQIERCAGEPDTTECTFPGADDRDFWCEEGVCIPALVCGDGAIDVTESCDGSELDGETCLTLGQGFTGGILRCGDDCAFDTTLCTTCGDGRCEQEETLDGCPDDCGAVYIAAGAAHNCVVLVDGTVRCWGLGDDGQLGNRDTEGGSAPLLVEGIVDAVSVGAGDGNTCALLAGGVVRCWGDNSDGVLGDGVTEHLNCGGYDCSPIPVPVAEVDDAVELAVGSWHACVIRGDGSLWCWGDNEDGQLGDGTAQNRFVPVPVAATALGTTQAVSLGGAHSCALDDAGGVRCWGWNGEGELGDGTGVSTVAPVEPTGLGAVARLGMGAWHSCVSLDDTSARCWGYNQYGELGDDSLDNAFAPVTVTGLTGVVAIDGGGLHTCALLTDGTARCWGANGSGQLGDATLLRRTTPVAVQGLQDVTMIASGGLHTCAIHGAGRVSCWGDNSEGQLGNGSYANATEPVAVVSWSGLPAE